MKKIVVLVLAIALLGLFGCGAPESNWEPSEIVETFVPGEHAIYDFSEFDPTLGPGMFSVNELTERYGKPEHIWADVSNALVLGIGVNFKDVGFSLGGHTERPGVEYCEVNPKSEYEDLMPNEEGMALPLPLRFTTVVGKKIPLPRGIRIGDSLEVVRAAYPEAPYGGEIYYANRYAQLTYLYGDTHVTFFFTKGEGVLTQVRIVWPEMEETP